MPAGSPMMVHACATSTTPAYPMTFNLRSNHSPIGGPCPQAGLLQRGIQLPAAPPHSSHSDPRSLVRSDAGMLQLPARTWCTKAPTRNLDPGSGLRPWHWLWHEAVPFTGPTAGIGEMLPRRPKPALPRPHCRREGANPDGRLPAQQRPRRHGGKTVATLKGLSFQKTACGVRDKEGPGKGPGLKAVVSGRAGDQTGGGVVGGLRPAADHPSRGQTGNSRTSPINCVPCQLGVFL